MAIMLIQALVEEWLEERTRLRALITKLGIKPGAVYFGGSDISEEVRSDTGRRLREIDALLARYNRPADTAAIEGRKGWLLH